MATERTSMSAVDAAWLHMDRPTNLMMIVGVWIFDQPLDVGRLREVVAARWLRHPRFRCRPVEQLTGPGWEVDRDFDLEVHVLRVALPAPAGKCELERLVSELASTPLDPARPMWEFQLVDNYATGAAVIMRIHHCYADGIALASVFQGLTDPQPGAAPFQHAPTAGRPGRRRKSRALPAIPGSALVQRALSGGVDWIGRITSLARHPEQAGELARQTLAASGEILHMVALPDDPDLPLRGPLGARKVAAWAEPLPLTEARAVARAQGCKINDVLMATVAGALGRYLLGLGIATDGLMLRATVPVNLRDPGRAEELGNQFGLVFLDLPVGIADPLQRLQQVSLNMTALKDSYQPVLTFGAMALFGLLGPQAERLAVDVLSAKATMVASNVAGPTSEVYIGGSRIRQLMFWVPQSGGIGLGISLLSYRGGVQFGVIADQQRMPEPASLAALFAVEFEAMVLATLMGPWLDRTRQPAD